MLIFSSIDLIYSKLQLLQAQDAGQEIYFSNTGDFCTENVVFEIGGKSKGRKQLREAKGASYVVKDDILIPFDGEIPLFYFGFLY